MYDSTSSDSFDSLAYWVSELQQQSDQSILICVVASKIDYSEKEEVPIKQASTYAKSIKASLHQTSAKDGTGVNELYQEIADKLYSASLAGEVAVSAK